MAGNHHAFSFHCMICFEEFDNTKLRYPVVLPCGHTYVCNSCGERLEKCMECRTPLYMTLTEKGDTSNAHNNSASSSNPGVVPNLHATSSRSSWSGPTSRRGVPIATSGAPSQTVKKRLPLPKNVVLLSLIEATELATARVHKDMEEKNTVDESEAASAEAHVIHSIESMDNLEVEEEQKINLATSLSVGVAGTYAVATRDGLEIFPSRPLAHPEEITFPEEDVDTLVQFFHMDKNKSSLDDESLTAEPSEHFPKELARLAFADRVQIVSVEEGWAKLARGYGYVRADKNQLVKVGNPVDRACKLEAMIRGLSTKRKELRMQQSDVDNKFVRLMSDLQLSLQSDEDLTVICGTAFAEAAMKDNSQHSSQPGGGMRSEVAEEKKEISPTADTDTRNAIYPQKPSQATEIEPVRTGLICFAPDVLHPGSDDDGGIGSNGNRIGPTPLSQIQETFSMTDVTASARQLLTAADASALFPVASHPSPSEMRAGAQAWRERQTEAARSDVDFRTGMSGHTALMSTKKHPHELLDEEEITRERVRNLRMSSHTGLTMLKRNKKLLGGFFHWGSPSPSNEDAGSVASTHVPPTSQPQEPHIHQTGSM